jgi:hypothetical protein
MATKKGKAAAKTACGGYGKVNEKGGPPPVAPRPFLVMSEDIIGQAAAVTEQEREAARQESKRRAEERFAESIAQTVASVLAQDRVPGDMAGKWAADFTRAFRKRMAEPDGLPEPPKPPTPADPIQNTAGGDQAEPGNGVDTGNPVG